MEQDDLGFLVYLSY